MSINLSDTTPAAPTGGFNVKWQKDASGNTSAYVGAASVPPTTFTPVAGVLTVDASKGSVAYVNINAAITSMSITNPTDGQNLVIVWIQDATGHAVTLASNLLGATAPSTAANKTSIQQFSYRAADTNWRGVAAGQTGL